MMQDDNYIRLRHCIRKDKIEEAKELISEIGVNYQFKNKSTPLILSCLFRNSEMISYCLSMGADVNPVDNDRESALLICVKERLNKESLELISLGAEVNSINKYGMTPLSWAVAKFQGDMSLIQKLLEHGADPYLKLSEKDQGYSKRAKLNALEYAKEFNMPEVAEFIITFKHDKDG